MGNHLTLRKAGIAICFLVSLLIRAEAQVPVNEDSTTTINDTIPVSTDTILRIKNLNPFFTLHVDSTLQYNLEINKDESGYYWFLRNSPVGLRINKDNGL